MLDSYIGKGVELTASLTSLFMYLSNIVLANTIGPPNESEDTE